MTVDAAIAVVIVRRLTRAPNLSAARVCEEVQHGQRGLGLRARRAEEAGLHAWHQQRFGDEGAFSGQLAVCGDLLQFVMFEAVVLLTQLLDLDVRRNKNKQIQIKVITK
jgi:hypothetical protein